MTSAADVRSSHRPERRQATGLAWAETVPATWTATRLGGLGTLVSGGTPSSENATFWDGDIPWLSPKDMKRAVIADTIDHVSERGAVAARLRIVGPDAIVFVVRGMILAHSFPVAITARPMTVNQDMKALLLRRGVHPQFVRYMLEGLREQMLSLTDEAGHGTVRLRMELWKSFRTFLPPLDEQRAIAAFLDRETARIDALVVKHECLTQQMHDYRSAVATAAVLRGLAPGALARQDVTKRVICAASGWVTRRVRQVVEFIGSGKTPLGGAESYASEGILLIRSQNVHDDGLRLDDVAYIDEATDNSMSWSRVRASDVLLNITGASIGRCSLVPEKFPRANVNQHVCIVRPRTGAVDPAFLHLALSSDFVAAQIDAIEDGVSREALTFSDVGNLWFPMPLTVAAQRELVAATCARVGSIDAVCARSRVVVDRLREYRSALITAAVTGQIDVRSEVAA